MARSKSPTAPGPIYAAYVPMQSYTGPAAGELIANPPFSILKDLPSYAQRFPWKYPKHKPVLSNHTKPLPKFDPFKWLARAAWQDDIRPVLTWAYAETLYGQRAIVSTDIYRMHILWEGAEQYPDEVQFPKSVGTQLEGKFPDVGSVLLHSAHEITLEAQKLYRAVKRALVFARDSANSVKFVYTPAYGVGQPGQLEVIGMSAERGDCSTLLDCSSDITNPYTWSANGQYVLEALIPYLKGNVSIHVRSSNRPFMIGQVYQYISLIMPMSLNEERNPIEAQAYTNSLQGLKGTPQAPTPLAATQVLGQMGGYKIVVRVG